MELGESLHLETIGHEADTGEMDHSNLSETEVASSMDEILNASSNYDAKLMGKAGGNIQVGAMTLEQIQQQKAHAGFGPRNAPPGMDAPQQTAMPPGPNPPGLPPKPRPKGN
jgi:hypothetical protein